MAAKNEINDKIDDASFIFGTTMVGTTTAAKVAKESLPKTRRFRVADKIGRLIRHIEK